MGPFIHGILGKGKTTLRLLVGTVVEAALGQRVLGRFLWLANNVVDSVVHESFDPIAGFHTVQGYLYVGDCFSSGVLGRGFAELSGEEELSETDGSKGLLHLAGVFIDLLVCVLRLAFLRLHQDLQDLFQKLPLQLETISSDHFDALVLDRKIKGRILAS